MTPRSLFNIILKVLGILFLKEILIFIPQLFAIFSAAHFSEFILSAITSVSIMLVYIFICYLLIFKTDFLINKLQLYKGFDGDFIPLNIHHSTILSIAIIAIGGLILVNEIPNLCTQLFEYFRLKKEGYTEAKISYSVLAVSKILIGLLLIIYQRHIVNLIEYKRKKA